MTDVEKTADLNFKRIINQNEDFQQLNIEVNKGLWIFGYGSLLWKVNFEYEKDLFGTIKGFARRFWQESTDHRGTTQFPGRVVTLVPREDNVLWGRAFYIPPASVKETMDTLNFREKGGYSLTKVLFQPDNAGLKEMDVFLYMGSKGNPNYAGEETLDNIAARIAKAVGPSGPNVNYLYNLASVLEQYRDMIGEDDREHTLALKKKVDVILLNNKV
eukprot:TCONS_00053592-protein